MAIAGSVAPVFRDGGYDATATYDFYHAIIYNNKLYFCRQDGTIGHEPQEESDEYWFLSIDGNIVDASTLNGKTESELSVANSEKLGGKGASEYALAGELATSYDGWGDKRTEDTNIQDYVYKMVFVGIKVNSAINMVAPNSTYSYVFGLLGFSDTSGGKAHELAFNHDGIWHRQIDGDNSKTDWERLSTTADLANKLDKTGGTASGELGASNGCVTIGGNPNVSNVFLRASADLNNAGFIGHYHELDSNTALKYGRYRNGLIEGQWDILHTGNKPSGTYTGNGDATERIIYTNGIGTTCAIFNPIKGFSILTAVGTMCFPRDGEPFYLQATEAEYPVAIRLNTINGMLNEAGITYDYQVL